MAQDTTNDLQGPRTPSEWTSRQTSAWGSALGVAFVLLVCLDWLLVRLLWLPLFSGLFFFLVAGLLVGGLSFRLARNARPMTKKRIAGGVLLVAFMSILVTICLEYRHVTNSIGSPPKFASVRNELVREVGSSARIDALVSERFKQQLTRDFPPGGPVGYVRWTLASGKMELEVEGTKEIVSTAHRGLIWPARTLAALLLTAAGLWLSFEALQSSDPVSNVLAPGEEYEEID